MLNELLIVERGARQADIKVNLRHPEVKDAAKKPTLQVFLNTYGHVAKVRAVASHRLKERSLWKLVEGQKNSFPFVQPKPLWINEAILSWKQSLSKKSSDMEKRQIILELASDSNVRFAGLGEWTSKGMMKALLKRRKQLIPLERSDVAALPVTIDRFRLACDKAMGGDPAKLISEIANRLIEELKRSTSPDLLATAVALFVETGSNGGALYFDAEGNFPFDLTDDRVQEPLCQLLRKIDLEGAERTGVCSVTGLDGVLVTGNFSQPNLPVIQQSFLFARNQAIPSASRYGKLSSASIPVGYMTDIRLRAALEALCVEHRRGKTWKAIPSEIPKQRDLLLAFVEGALNAPVAEVLTDKDNKMDFTEEEIDSAFGEAFSVAAFEKRTERLIEAVRGKVSGDFSKTPVRLIVLRKVDTANRKVIYSGSLTVSDLYQAATTWVAGERNLPSWVMLPVLMKGERKPRPMPPPHIAPLGLIAFSKQIFLRSGKRPKGKKKEQVGLPAAEALRFFLDPVGNGDLSERRRAERILRLVLKRRVGLIAGTAHGLRRGGELAKDYDRHEVLRTVTLLGVLLYKLGKNKEVYMNETAFKLGQLLAAADVVHAGYCADVRGGNVPPSLLGNQVFAMAQSSPVKALAMLCRRWKPYDGWAKKTARSPNRINAMIENNKKDEQQRGWDIKKALRHAREMGLLATDLALALDGCRVDDTFRSVLLLGYIAGLPKAQWEDIDAKEHNQNVKKEG